MGNANQQIQTLNIVLYFHVIMSNDMRVFMIQNLVRLGFVMYLRDACVRLSFFIYRKISNKIWPPSPTPPSYCETLLHLFRKFVTEKCLNSKSLQLFFGFEITSPPPPFGSFPKIHKNKASEAKYI